MSFSRQTDDGVSTVSTGTEGPRADQRMVVVGTMLASSGEALLRSLRSPVRTSGDLIKAAGVNKDIASRFLNALGKRDPMAVAYYIPGWNRCGG